MPSTLRGSQGGSFSPETNVLILGQQAGARLGTHDGGAATVSPGQQKLGKGGRLGTQLVSASLLGTTALQALVR